MRTYPAELTPPISLWFPICYIVKDFMFVKTSKLLAANTTEFQKAESGLRVKVVFIWQVNGNFLSFQKNYSQTSVEASIHFFLPVRMLQQSSCYKSPGHLIHSTPLLALRPLVWMSPTASTKSLTIIVMWLKSSYILRTVLSILYFPQNRLTDSISKHFHINTAFDS